MKYKQALKKMPKRNSDGYYDATEICKAISKTFGNWHRNKRTKKLVEILLREGEEPIKFAKTSNDGPCHTWVCKELALNLMEWGKLLPDEIVQRMEKMRQEEMRQKKETIELFTSKTPHASVPTQPQLEQNLEIFVFRPPLWQHNI